jgi:hypothetical protein
VKPQLRESIPRRVSMGSWKDLRSHVCPPNLAYLTPKLGEMLSTLVAIRVYLPSRFAGFPRSSLPAAAHSYSSILLLPFSSSSSHFLLFLPSCPEFFTPCPDLCCYKILISFYAVVAEFRSLSSSICSHSVRTKQVSINCAVSSMSMPHTGPWPLFLQG